MQIYSQVAYWVNHVGDFTFLRPLLLALENLASKQSARPGTMDAKQPRRCPCRYRSPWNCPRSCCAQYIQEGWRPDSQLDTHKFSRLWRRRSWHCSSNSLPTCRVSLSWGERAWPVVAVVVRRAGRGWLGGLLPWRFCVMGGCFYLAIHLPFISCRTCKQKQFLFTSYRHPCVHYWIVGTRQVQLSRSVTGSCSSNAVPSKLA